MENAILLDHVLFWKMNIKFIFIWLTSILGIYTMYSSQDDGITIFMIGDSTMANRPYIDGNPVKGWGQVFGLYFNSSVSVENHAKSGRSTKSFIDEGRWAKVKENLSPGDFVIIQFGHNDEKINDTTRYRTPADYQVNLEKYISETRELGGHPIIATPIVRRRFDEKGKFFDTHGQYPEAARRAAKNNQVPLLDLHQASLELVAHVYGEERSKILFLHIPAGEYPSLQEDRADDTHLSAIGAFRICDLAAAEIRKHVPELANYLKK